MKLLHENKFQSKSYSTVRDNLMNEKDYSPYCYCNGLYRMKWDDSINQFVCCLGRCGNTQFPIGFIINYKRKWEK